MSEQYKDDPLVRAMNRANAKDWQARALKAEDEASGWAEIAARWEAAYIKHRLARFKAEADLKTANTEVGRLNIQLRTRALKAEAMLREARPYVADAGNDEDPEAQTLSGELLAEIDAILARAALPQDENAK